jgi:hypothetical protein
MKHERHLILRPRLGVDIGRVIIGTAALGGHGDTTFLSGGDEAAMATPAAAGAFDALARLTEELDGQVWLVSKCGARIEARTRAWLRHHRFHDRTGIPPSHLRFCKKRHEKRAHAEALGLGFFVDDRSDVLRHLVGVVPRLYLFGHQKPRAARLADAVPVLDWASAERTLLEDLEVLGRNAVDEPDAVVASKEDVTHARHGARGDT